MEAWLVDVLFSPKQNYNYRDEVDEPSLAEGGHRGFWELSRSHHLRMVLYTESREEHSLESGIMAQRTLCPVNTWQFEHTCRFLCRSENCTPQTLGWREKVSQYPGASVETYWILRLRHIPLKIHRRTSD